MKEIQFFISLRFVHGIQEKLIKNLYEENWNYEWIKILRY